MTTTAINATNLTLLDRIKRTNPDGSEAVLVEMLEKECPIIKDAAFVESNLPTGHLVSMRSGLPSIGWRRFNEGISPSKSKTDQVTESCGMLGGWSKVDVALANLGGNPAGFRFSEDMAFMQAMQIEMETGMFYHSTKTAPEKFMGLAPRLSATTDPYGDKQIVLADAAPSGSDQTSIWLVGWGDKKVYGIYPKGTIGGIQSKDHGELPVDMGSGKLMNAYMTEWKWQIGLVVEDARYVVRIGNIDTSALVGTGTSLIDAMIKATYKIPSLSSCRPVFYTNRTVATFLHLQAKDSLKNATLSYDTVGGKPIGSFGGIPIHTTDAILNTEAVIA